MIDTSLSDNVDYIMRLAIEMANAVDRLLCMDLQERRPMQLNVRTYRTRSDEKETHGARSNLSVTRHTYCQ